MPRPVKGRAAGLVMGWQHHGHRAGWTHQSAGILVFRHGRPVCARDQSARLPDGADLVNLVGVLTGKHDRHVERLGRPSAMAESGEGPLMPDKSAP